MEPARNKFVVRFQGACVIELLPLSDYRVQRLCRATTLHGRLYY